MWARDVSPVARARRAFDRPTATDSRGDEGLTRGRWGTSRRPALDAAITRALTEGTDDDVEVQVDRGDDAGLRRCYAKVRALTEDAEATGAIISIEDVTESAHLRAELERRAISTGSLGASTVRPSCRRSKRHCQKREPA